MIAKKLNIPPTLLRKNACTVELNIYHIPVNTCQVCIHQRGNISQAAANK
jgi:sulfur relay (sulfurtransferase) complex TusBCD TusD component (DsrE family)